MTLVAAQHTEATCSSLQDAATYDWSIPAKPLVAATITTSDGILKTCSLNKCIPPQPASFVGGLYS